MKVLGIDPGLDGALATWDGRYLKVVDIPTVKAKSRGRDVNLPYLASIVHELNDPPIDAAYVEKSSIRPKEGGASGRKTGLVAGLVLGCAAMCCKNIYNPTPTQWKKAMKLTKDKEYSRTKAIEIFPTFYEYFSRKKDHDRAEASLLAYYGYTLLLLQRVRRRPRKRL